MLKVHGTEQINLMKNAWKLLTPSEQKYLAHELSRDGITDGWAIVPYNAPQLLALFILCVDEIDVEEVEDYDEEQDFKDDSSTSSSSSNEPDDFGGKAPEISNTSIALSFGLQLLVKIFRSTRVILNQSRLQEQAPNGVYVVKTSHLAKEYVVRTILREEKFVQFSIFHKNRTGEIVLGHTWSFNF